MKDWKFSRLYLLWMGFASLLIGGLNPIVGDEFYFESAGGRLRYVVEGEGEPVLLVHGFAEDADKGWKRSGVIKGLVEVQFRVIAVDCLGHGGSARPHNLGVYGLSMAKGMIALLDSLEVTKVQAVGYSMGAALVNKLLELHPDRFRSITLSGYGQPPLPDRVTDELVEEIRVNLARMNLSSGNDPRALANLSVGWRDWHVLDRNLSQNRVPVLALIGVDDIFLADTRQLAENLARCQLTIVKGDHGTARSQAEYLATLLSFLKKNRAIDAPSSRP